LRRKLTRQLRARSLKGSPLPLPETGHSQVAKGGSIGRANQHRDAQADVYNELIANGGLWRVSDFVTLGSPLTHADILLADNAVDRFRKQNARELPTCLPVLETSKAGKNLSLSNIRRRTDPTAPPRRRRSQCHTMPRRSHRLDGRIFTSLRRR
jgi:hypothetical protein